MNSINLFTLTRVNDFNVFSKFEKQLSSRYNELKVREHEMNSIIQLVERLRNYGAKYNDLDNFYFSFEIPQIGKEFDLLRIGDNKIINIEVKSNHVKKEKIRDQLVKNKYYLAHLSCPLALFTFTDIDQCVYQLSDDDLLIEVTLNHLITEIATQTGCFCEDISTLFKVSDYLISPLNTPSKFLKGEYFLTSQQDEIKKLIFDAFRLSINKQFIGIAGSPGTGKTLLLFDLAKQCSFSGKCCVIHCGQLSEGHEELRKNLRYIDIIAAKSIYEDIDISQYKYIFIDESHRFYKKQFEFVVSKAEEFNIHIVFSYDSKQILSKNEKNANISSLIEKLPKCKIYKLSKKIRTNKEIASFIQKLFNQKANTSFEISNYPSVFIAFANNEEEAKVMIKNYRSDGFTFINYTKSTYNKGSFDDYYGDFNTHFVIGQEYDNVLMIMDKSFIYDSNGNLIGYEHPNPNYLYLKLLYQGLTRVREKIALIVIDNKKLFESILFILQG